MTFFEWIEQFASELESAEIPTRRTPYEQGVADGEHKAQVYIAKKLRYAIEQEKKKYFPKSLALYVFDKDDLK